MSLTSYRAAPPRVIRVLRSKSRMFWFGLAIEGRLLGGRSVSAGPACERRCSVCLSCVLQTWQRPTLPRLKTKYHRRWGVSRPCSEWERVQPPRQNHQVGKAQSSISRSWQAFAWIIYRMDVFLLPSLQGDFPYRPAGRRPTFRAARPERSGASRVSVRTKRSSTSSMIIDQ